jgi:ATP-dependent Lhr-like helicase
MTIGTIVSDAAVEVKWTSGGRLGTVEESFVSRLKPGEKFLFAGKPLSLFRFDGLTAWVKRAGRGPVGLQVPRWNGGRMPLSTLLASAVERIVADAGEPAHPSRRRSGGRSPRETLPELEAVRPLLATQAAWSVLPSPERLLVEVVPLKDGVHAFVFPFEGRLAHEGLAAVVAWRIAQASPCTLTFAVNDWGFEISGRSGLEEARHEAVWRRMLSPANLLEDLLACVNGTEMAKRHFKEVARVAGLVSDGGKGASRRVSSRNLQASAGLIFDVLSEHDPGNMLLAQARREVLEQQFEFRRLSAAVDRMLARELAVVEPGRLTPLAFPIWAEQIQNRFTSQGWLERITEMAAELEAAAAGRPTPRQPGPRCASRAHRRPTRG